MESVNQHTGDQAEQLRQKLKFLREKRDAAIFEKGLAADENKDLRENFAYDYWVQQETNLTCQINDAIGEIEHITNVKRHKRIPAIHLGKEKLKAELARFKKWL
jgi:transcription elongation GreA/GreB family factor